MTSFLKKKNGKTFSLKVSEWCNAILAFQNILKDRISLIIYKKANRNLYISLILLFMTCFKLFFLRMKPVCSEFNSSLCATESPNLTWHNPVNLPAIWKQQIWQCARVLHLTPVKYNIMIEVLHCHVFLYLRCLWFFYPTQVCYLQAWLCLKDSFSTWQEIYTSKLIKTWT